MVPRAQPHLSAPLTPSDHNKQTRTPSPYSFNSAGEADDERSSSPSTVQSMGSVADDDAFEEMPPPAYPGEDTRPTSRKELLGFYTYSFAAEVFVVCGLGAFVPITLEDLARASSSAVRADDHSKPCRAHSIDVSSHALDIRNAAKASSHQCVFKLFGFEINTASFAMYTFSISVLLQALVVVTMSGAADHGQYRKQFLVIFALMGSIATMLFLPVTPSVYLLGSLWAIVSNVCIGASFVLLNSFLPLLVRHHPSAGRRQTEGRVQLPADYDEVSQSIPYMPFVGKETVSRSEIVPCLAVSSSSRKLHKSCVLALLPLSLRRLIPFLVSLLPY